MNPNISVIIPVYNRESYLNTTIESVLNQTHTDFELIIWDDGSTDNSLNIANHYAQQDKRIKVIAAQHAGPTLALKDAFSTTTGNYVGWVDSDDVLAPTALEETAIFLDNNPICGMVYTDYLVINENNKVLGKGKRCEIPYSKDRLLVDFMTFHFRLMRKEVFLQAGGIDSESGFVQDYDLCLRISEITQINHLQRPLYYYRLHPGCISSQKRVELIYNTQQAIAKALERRKMSSEYDIEVEIVGHYYLKRKKEEGRRKKE
ncbi:filamentous hemagglutinin outer membrane protein (plasmid) [Calothrix parasitica NIES-267]|uniref:Filamentous hemagglutinin outer membrane protein n=1 Tax=Calothrix parasitica NIES-267 TaxID=1973488 RepID=A0A1Z4M2R0_9CYAN|nr:filamentous hemagglutinin outer membrane protein [Calothrix parasitica NIES-267]